MKDKTEKVVQNGGGNEYCNKDTELHSVSNGVLGKGLEQKNGMVRSVFHDVNFPGA